MRVYRGLSGRLLPCGCLVGSYETYAGTTVEIVDAPAPSCANPLHREGARLVAATSTPTSNAGAA